MARNDGRRYQHVGYTRRDLLKSATAGFSTIALAGMLQQLGLAEEPTSSSAFAPKKPHFPAKAKRVVFFFLNGGPSQLDTFDPKPLLNKYHGQPLPNSVADKRTFGQILGTPLTFSKHGKCGMEFSEIFPSIAKHADDICMIRSMLTDTIDHQPATILMNNGHFREVRPSMGSWISYGLGSMNQNLPSFIVLSCGLPNKGHENWQAGFLPGIHQGTYIDPLVSKTEPLPNLSNASLSKEDQRKQLNLLQSLNRHHWESRQKIDPLDTRIQSFELAFRMQTEASEAFDLSKESKETKARYGETDYGNQALLARRLLERGVRFLQIYQGSDKPWDTHDMNAVRHRQLAGQCDQPIGAFIQDLKDRDMLKDTLIIVGGEFGRSATSELKFSGSEAMYVAGRDHNRECFTMLLLGGGTKSGFVYGKTDDFSVKTVENPVHVHDFHATVLHLMGLDHKKLTFMHSGREYRLTDEFGNVVNNILA